MDHLELEWEESQRRVVRSMSEGDYAAAQSELDSFLSHPHDPEARNDALGFRAHCQERSGNLESAKRDLLEAHALSQPLSYARCVDELCLGDLCEKLNAPEEAAHWCRAALATALQAGFPEGSALRRYVRLRGQSNLNSEELALCVAVARQSWKKLQLPGDPDVTHLERTAQELIQGESRPRRDPRPRKHN